MATVTSIPPFWRVAAGGAAVALLWSIDRVLGGLALAVLVVGMLYAWQTRGGKIGP